MESWEEEQPFDEQQQQMKWVGVAFYFLGAAFGVFQLVIISLHHTNLRRTRTKKIIFCVFTLAFLLRKFRAKLLISNFFLIEIKHNLQFGISFSYFATLQTNE